MRYEVNGDLVVNSETGEIMAEWNDEKYRWVVDEYAAKNYEGYMVGLCIWMCGKVPDKLKLY